MIYLIFSILCSTIISVVFRLFKDYEIDTFQAIIYNYIVCLTVGSLIMGDLPVKYGFWTLDWFPYAAVLGGIFISAFILIAKSIEHYGISITSVVQRMSLILTVSFAIFFFQESLSLFKIIGIICALGAVVLASFKKEERKLSDGNKPNKWLILLPISVLLSSGLIECVLQYVEGVVLKGSVGGLQFTTVLFGTAASIGTIILIFSLLTGRMVFKIKNLIAGIALGIPNFGSIYFLLAMLGVGWERSVIFPINNVAVILFSVFVALLFFKEKLSKLNWVGIILAIAAIVLIAYAQ